MKKKLLVFALTIMLVSTLVFCLCSCDDDKNKSQEDDYVCAHEFVEVASTEYLKSEATCTSQAVYYKSCSKCKAAGADTFKYGDYKSHQYVDDVCTSCGMIKESVYNEALESKGYVIKGNNIYFGSYPQSLVLNASILDSLNSTIKAYPSYSDAGDWTSFGFTESSSGAEYMWYYDVNVLGGKYRAFYFASYRPVEKGKSNSIDESSQDNNGYFNSSIYWFKFEPIKWDIIDQGDGSALIVSSLVLDSHEYYENTSSRQIGEERIYPSNYECSTIREWLNATFIKTAFDENQEILLTNQILDNKYTSDTTTNRYSIYQNNTKDLVFLLSYQDILSKLNTNSLRIKHASDYSKALGVNVNNSIYNTEATWLSRSAHNVNGYEIFSISSTGEFTGYTTNYTNAGIVPAVRIRLCSSTDPKGHVFEEIVSEEALKEEATCEHTAVYYKTCRFCGAKSNEMFNSGEKLGHIVVEVQDSKYLKSTATCTEPLIFYKSCSRCGEALEETFTEGVALGHNHDITKIVEPTCEEQGYNNHICSRCGHEIHDTFTSALEHIIVDNPQEEYLVHLATCTEPITYHKSCSRCGESVEATFTIGNALGHQRAEIIEDQYLRNAATCTSRAIYYKSCSRCGCALEDTFGYGDELGHDYLSTVIDPTCLEKGYTIHKCTRCKDEYIDSEKAALGHQCGGDYTCDNCGKVCYTGNYLRDGDYIYFGSYPQKLITSPSLIESLNGIAPLSMDMTDTSQLTHIWTKYDKYFVNGVEKDFMWYVDVELYGEKFRGVYCTEKRTELVNDKYPADVDGAYKVDNIYWFSYEPIKWRILEALDGEVLLLSCLAIDAQDFNYQNNSETISGITYYSNDWKISHIKNWLNETFYQTAFNKSEKAIIAEQTNTCVTPYKYLYSTTDKVSLLSDDDLINIAYGFDDADSTLTRSIKGTDYAKSQGLAYSRSAYAGSVIWWSRSAKSSNTTDAACVDIDGSIMYSSVLHANYGILPVVKIALSQCSGTHEYTSEIVEPTCDKNGYTLFICKHCASSYIGNETPANGHAYHDGICKVCGGIDEDEVRHQYELKGYAKSGNTIYFGGYPQSRMANDSITSVLDNKAGELPTASDPKKWTNYGFYKSGSNAEAYMWYIEIYYGAVWYRGVYFTEYRPINPNDDGDEVNSYIKGNGYEAGNIYWFAYEAIQWHVMRQDGVNAYLNADLSLDYQYFYYTPSTDKERTINGEIIYENNYEYSFIREWLNSTFYSEAFNELQKSLMVAVPVDNKNTSMSADSSKQYSENQHITYDKIYIPSVADLTDTSLGYAEDFLENDWWRQNESSDYAKVLGVYRFDGGGLDKNGYAMTRSCSDSGQDKGMQTDYAGNIIPYFVEELCGVNMSIVIQILECYEDTDHDFVNGVCQKCGAVNIDDLIEAIGTNDYVETSNGIYMGLYPQSRVYDDSIINELNNLYPAVPTPYNNNGWTAFEKLDSGLPYIWTIDVSYNGKYYRAVYQNENRRQKYGSDVEGGVYSNYYEKEVYWFKYEPIKWDKVKNTEGGELLVSSFIIDSSMYAKSSLVDETNPSEWKKSYLNYYLQHYIYEPYFSNSQKAYIEAFDEGEYLSIMTEEDLNEYVNVQYYNSSKIVTDYAQCMGASVSYYNHNYYGNWYINKQYDETNVYYIDSEGSIVETAFVTSTFYGVVPTLNMNYCQVKHDYIEVANDKYLVSAANCTSKAVYYKTCSRCGTVSTETFEYGDILGHDFEYTCKGTCECTRCGKKESIYTNNGDTLKMGLYPQSLVTDMDIISDLNSILYFTQSALVEGWTSIKTINPRVDFDLNYKDFEYNNEKYRCIYYVTLNSDLTAAGYNLSSYYWYKYEPINWRVIIEEDSSVTLISNLLLDGIEYSYASPDTLNDYRTSYIRNWLNDEFVNVAFNDGEKSILIASVVDNSAKSTGFNNETNKINNNAGFDTLDKVWLLSINDLTNTKYGFVETNEEDINRTFVATDYAKAVGVFNANALTRSPSASFDNVVGYVENGIIKYTYMVSKAYAGINPVIRIQIIDDHEYEEKVINATCTDEGYTLHTCKNCGHTYKSDYVASLGHTGGKATCKAKAVCDRCHESYGELSGHDYRDGICSTCGLIDESALNAAYETKGYAHCEDSVYFGSYPQELVTNESIKAALNQNVTLPDSSNDNGWTSYYYYIGSINTTNFMWYLDKTYGGSKYRGVYFTSYRPSDVTSTSIPENTYQDDNGYDIGTVYWFKYTPIKWRILTSDSNIVTMIAVIAIDSQSYQNTTSYYSEKSDYYAYGNGVAAGTKYANDYAISSIRSWLNNEFYKTAFSTNNKQMVIPTTIDNSRTALQGDTCKYAVSQVSTTDNVYILAYSDYINDEYGYNASALVNDIYKCAKATDYAKIQGVYTVDGYANYLSRSAYYSNIKGGNAINIVNEEGNSGSKGYTSDASLGVLPVIQIDFCANAHDYVQKIEDSYLKTKATCQAKAVYNKVCSHCGKISTETYEYGEFSGHDYEETITDATCTEEGLIQRVCKDCGDIDEEIIPALGHIGGEATCSAKAICDRCHEEYGVCLPHHYSDKCVKVDPTCIKDGYYIYTCEDCDHEYYEIFAGATGHGGGYATCISKARCSACGEEYGTFADHNYIITVIAPTCSTPGYTIHTCSVCGSSYTTDAKESLGHNFVSTPSGAYLVSKSTCTCPAVYYQKCSRCGAKSDNKYEVGEPLGHTYSNGICTTCGDKVVKRVDENGNESVDGNCILFGSYPQKEIKYSENQKLVMALNDKSGIGNGSVGETVFQECWKNGTYSTFDGSNCFYYIDIWYMGKQYRGIWYKNSLRNSNVKEYFANSVYWFEYQPILWRIVQQSDGEAIVVANSIIDSREISTDGLTDTYWAGYYIYTWLNDEFYKTAFALQEQKDLIIKTDQFNSINAEDWDTNVDAGNQDDTQCNVYLLSIFEYNHLKNNAGFYATEYARYNGAVYTSDTICSYTTRSTKSNSVNMVVTKLGNSTSYRQVTLSNNISPAIRIKICYNHSYVNGKCRFCGDIAYTITEISNNKYYSFGSYPQSKVTDADTLKYLNKIVKTNPTVDALSWTGFEYYDLTGSTYAWYKDVELMGQKYRAIYLSLYKPEKMTGTASSTDSTFSSKGVELGKVIWYKYEPIKWVEVEDKLGESVLLATSILDAMSYGTATTWSDSIIRSWLNVDFYESAFSSIQQKLIIQQLTDNKTGNNNVLQHNTYDYVTILSGVEWSEYSDYLSLIQTTDYSISQRNFDNYCYTRFAQSSSDNCLYAFSGKASMVGPSTYVHGVVPMITICNCAHEFEHSAGCLICSLCRRIIYQKSTSAQENTYDMGMYPTKLVEDLTIIDNLNQLVPSDYSAAWNVLYNDANSSMYYLDVYYNGDLYRGVVITNYKTIIPGAESNTTNSYQDDYGYVLNSVYWFKYTTLTWVEINYNNVHALVCTTVIDAMAYNSTQLDSLWDNSGIKTWLNSVFVRDALDEHIMDACWPEDGVNVRLLTKDEVQRLVVNQISIDATDYAKVQGVKIVDGEVTYTTMTSDSAMEMFIVDEGSITTGAPMRTYYGVVPVILIQ